MQAFVMQAPDPGLLAAWPGHWVLARRSIASTRSRTTPYTDPPQGRDVDTLGS